MSSWTNCKEQINTKKKSCMKTHTLMKFFPLLKLWKLSIKMKLEKIDVYFMRIKSIRKDTYAEYNIQAKVELNLVPRRVYARTW